jgi:23S rRNA (pseudouridine1915-N3)-methyltransferase
MTLRFLLPGKCRETYLAAGYQEYCKRLSRFGKVSLVSLPEAPLPPNPSQALIAQALEKEAASALALLKPSDYLFLVDIHAPQVTSATFAAAIGKALSSKGNLVFLFGSSYGLSDTLRKRADVSFSLSALTFTHYEACFLTLEQVYRALKILAGETYDK